MIYSIWNYGSRQYDYYESGGSPSTTHAATPGRPLFGNKLGVTPEQAAVKLPLGARKVGSGTAARGSVASRASMAGFEPSSITSLLIASGLAYAAWRYLR